MTDKSMVVDIDQCALIEQVVYVNCVLAVNLPQLKQPRHLIALQ